MTLTTIDRVYQPHGAARRMFESRRPEVLISGPAGTGKSRAILEKLNIVLLKYPGARGLLLRKTQESLKSTGLVTWREKVVPEALDARVLKYYGGGPERPAQYEYQNGSVLVLGGLDKATKIMSSEYDVAVILEATELTLDDWEAVTTRLRNGVMPYQQVLADCNPAQPTHWLKQRADAGTTLMLESRHEDNPTLVNRDGTRTERGETYLSRLDVLTGVRKSRLRDGKWVAAEGLIYEEYDPAVHLVDHRPIPEAWPRWWTVDFGFRHALVFQRWAVDPDGRLFLYRELYRRGLLVEDAARLVLDDVAPGGVWREPRPTAVICDHDAEDRATLERHLGFSTTPAEKAVTPGIQAVQSRLRPAGDGKPRLFLLRDCQQGGRQEVMVEAGQPASTAEEFAGYVWDTGGGKRILEQPIKVFDDGLDALRYMVAQEDLGGRPNVRWM